MNASLRKVLIVDDHPVVQTCLTEFFNAQPSYEVCAKTGDFWEALDLIGELKPDLAIVDVSIESGNGLNLLKRAKNKKLSKKTRYLVLSAHSETVVAPHAFAVGASGYVNKQTPMEEMLQAIEEIFDGGQHFPEFVTNEELQRLNTQYENKLAELTVRELEILEHLGNGYTSSETAKILSLSVKTIDSHRENIKKKLGLQSANELMLHAVYWVMGKTPESKSDG